MPVKPFIMQFWERDIGATWLSFERKKIMEYSKIRSNEKITLSGYVKLITSSVFALVPTLFSNQTYLLCVNYTDEMPPDNSYISVSGETKYELVSNRQTPKSTIFNGEIVVNVSNWTKATPALEEPKSYLEYKDFRKDLTRRFEGLEEKIVDFLAFTAVSAPSFNGSTGGVNLTMYDSTNGQSSRASLSRKLCQEMQLAIPDGIKNTCKVATCYGSFDMGYKYTFLSEDADKVLSKKTEAFLAHQTSQLMPNCTETSVSLFSGKDKPVTIEDLPCSLTDIPTVVSEGVTFFGKKRSIDPFDSFNFIMASHFKMPICEDTNALLSETADKLEKLAADFDLDPRHVAKYGFLNANYNARPMSVLRNSLAYARAQNIGVVTTTVAGKIFNDYFRWNFEYVHEVWDDLLNQPLIGHRTPAALREKYREIIRIIRKHYSSHTPGVSRSIIIGEAKTSPLQTAQLIDECNNSGIIYQPVAGFYRLTRDDA